MTEALLSLGIRPKCASYCATPECEPMRQRTIAGDRDAGATQNPSLIFVGTGCRNVNNGRKFQLYCSMKSSIMFPDVRQRHSAIVRPLEPEQKFAPSGNGVDPRLVELVRLLARRAAREWYEQKAKDCPRS